MRELDLHRHPRLAYRDAEIRAMPAPARRPHHRNQPVLVATELVLAHPLALAQGQERRDPRDGARVPQAGAVRRARAHVALVGPDLATTGRGDRDHTSLAVI